jgi:hypothetical protein
VILEDDSPAWLGTQGHWRYLLLFGYALAATFLIDVLFRKR